MINVIHSLFIFNLSKKIYISFLLFSKWNMLLNGQYDLTEVKTIKNCDVYFMLLWTCWQWHIYPPYSWFHLYVSLSCTLTLYELVHHWSILLSKWSETKWALFYQAHCHTCSIYSCKVWTMHDINALSTGRLIEKKEYTKLRRVVRCNKRSTTYRKD